MSEFRAPRVMGIINCTPDSFYPGSRRGTVDSGLEAARRMMADGADILDIGGESTRPGSSGVEAGEQIERVVPLIRRIRDESDIPVSIDTRSARVAEAALDAGADIINDISALTGDPAMGALAAERDVPVVLMHMRGRPETMQDKPRYDDVVSEVTDSLMQAVERARNAGISERKIILDPGIGFGKRLEDNLALLARLADWRPAGYPVLVGLSRKSFLGLVLDGQAGGAGGRRAEPGTDDLFARGEPAGRSGPRTGGGAAAESPGPSTPDDRLTATIAAHAWCLKAGADILRVHDVKETRQLIAVWEALEWAS